MACSLHHRLGVTLIAAILAVAICGATAGANDLDLLVFDSTDAGTSAFTTVGAKLAQKDDGPALLLTAGGGARRERLRTPAGGHLEARRYVLTTAAVFGYQWSLDGGTIGAFAGPEGTLDLLTTDQGLARKAIKTGLRLQQETWFRPSEETLIQATLVASTSRRSLWTRVAGGIHLGEGYIGPEVGYYADATGYQKLAAGVHATDFTLAGRHFRMSVGGLLPSDSRRVQPYFALAVWEDW